MNIDERISVVERALSLTQPWAWLIVSAAGHWKNVENRRPGFSHKSFRGDFLVHATGSCSPKDYQDCRRWVEGHIGEEVLEQIPRRDELLLGGVVGIARVVSLIAPEETHRPAQAGTSVIERWHMPEQYGFVLEDRAALPFVPCGGALGFWRVPNTVKELLARRLRGTL